MKVANFINRAFNKVVKKSQWYKRFWDGATKFWTLNQFDLECINLGSNSAKCAFCYDDTEIKGMNWAIGPQSLQFDFSILRNYYSYLSEGAYVIITLCPFSCLDSKYDKKQILKYYTFLHPATIHGFDENERVKALKIKNNPFKEMPKICIKNTLKEILRKCIKKRAKKVNYEQNAESYIINWKRQFGISDLEARINDHNLAGRGLRVEVLKDMIDFCLERGLRPIIVIPPISKPLNNLLTPQFKQTYIYSFISDANITDVPIFDFIGSEDFDDDKYFRDAFLLNELGAMKFTSEILSLLGNIDDGKRDKYYNNG